MLLYLISKEFVLNSEKSNDCESYTNQHLFLKSNSEDFNLVIYTEMQDFHTCICMHAHTCIVMPICLTMIGPGFHWVLAQLVHKN